jgi:chromosome partitioning protein
VRLLFEKTDKGESRLHELAPVAIGPNLSLLGSDVSLAVYEVEAGGPGRFYKLRTYLNAHADGWTIIDTPPNLAVLTVNALLACNFVLIPVDASKFSVRGLADLFSTIRELNTDLRSGPGQQLKVAGVVLSNVTPRFSYAQKVIDELRQLYAPFIMDTMIPASTRVREATAGGRIVTEGTAAPAFEAFYAELQRRIV